MELEEHESLFRDWARRTMRFSSKQFDTLLQYTHDALNDPKRATVPANLASHPIPLAYCLAYLQANASCSELASGICAAGHFTDTGISDFLVFA